MLHRIQPESSVRPTFELRNLAQSGGEAYVSMASGLLTWFAGSRLTESCLGGSR